MKKLLKSASGFQTLLNLCIIAQLIIISVTQKREFIVFDMSGYNETYFFVGGFLGMVLLSLIPVWKTYRKHQRNFLFQNEALEKVSRRFSLFLLANGFFCFTFAVSLVGNYEIAEVFSFGWALIALLVGYMCWYILLYLSVYVGRLLFYHPPENTLDQALWEEEGDF